MTLMENLWSPLSKLLKNLTDSICEPGASTRYCSLFLDWVKQLTSIKD